MTTHAFHLPDVGEGVAEAEIDRWYVAVGDRVEEDQLLVSVLTDKATLDIPSPVAGTVTELAAAVGEIVAVGSELVQFQTGDDETTLSSTPKTSAVPGPPATATSSELRLSTTSAEVGTPAIAFSIAAGAATEGRTRPTGTGRQVSVTSPEPSPAHRRVLASPAVRRAAADAGIDLRRLASGSGPVGQVTHADLRAFADAPTTQAPALPRRTQVTDVPVTGIRRAIGRQMATSNSRIPHITLVEEVDVTSLESLRVRLNGKQEDVRQRLTPLAFLVRALVLAVGDHPVVNARFDDDEQVVHRYAGVHVGLATQTDDGLKVPVLRHAETMDLWAVARLIEDRSRAARDGSVSHADMGGSTITVSSLGALGGIANTPIINHPEVAIIGVNSMQVRPHWDGQQFVPRKKMNLSSSFDHRVVDGWHAAVFLHRFKELLEEPALMFVEGA